MVLCQVGGSSRWHSTDLSSICLTAAPAAVLLPVQMQLLTNFHVAEWLTFFCIDSEIDLLHACCCSCAGHVCMLPYTGLYDAQDISRHIKPDSGPMMAITI